MNNRVSQADDTTDKNATDDGLQVDTSSNNVSHTGEFEVVPPEIVVVPEDESASAEVNGSATPEGGCEPAPEQNIIAGSRDNENPSATDATLPQAEDGPTEASNVTGAFKNITKPDSEQVNHRYEHRMILCRMLAEGSSVTEPTKPTVEEQLVSFTERFDSLESGVRRLEEMMNRLLHSAAIESSPDVGATMVSEA